LLLFFKKEALSLLAMNRKLRRAQGKQGPNAAPEAMRLIGLGRDFQAKGRPQEAIAAYRRAVAFAPGLPEAWNNLGNALLEAGRPEDAAQCYRRALHLHPDFVPALINLGNALGELGRLDEALAVCRRAVDAAPLLPDAHNNLGTVLRDRQDFRAASACFRAAIALAPGDPAGYVNLADALTEMGQLEEAEAACRRAIRLAPELAEAHTNLGVALRRQGRLAEATASYRRALALRPELGQDHFNLAVALLAQGEMPEGWAAYEWRWRTKQMRGDWRAFAQPQWRGEPAPGKILLLHAEQGFGDTLQFCRYAPLAAARGLRVILEVQPALLRLMESLEGVELVCGRGGALPHFDLHAPLLSLPGALGTTVETIPAAVPYLHAAPAAASAWKDRLASLGERRLVGLVWAGNARRHLPAQAAADRRRSISPALLAPLFEVPGIRFVSLQKDGPATPDFFNMIDLMGEVSDFADTAALVANLDLVISVDTAVAHLAGALGRPVWLLNRLDSCWRWLAGRRDSPWYPGMRLYNQSRPGDWAAVIAEVAADLRGFANMTVDK
jgi:tetratricopeptide (TPR) repeat protein